MPGNSRCDKGSGGGEKRPSESARETGHKVRCSEICNGFGREDEVELDYDGGDHASTPESCRARDGE